MEESKIPEQDIDALILLFNSGQLEKLIDKASELLKVFPNHPFLFNISGAAAARNRQFDLAEKFLKCALDVEPNNAAANNNLGNILIGQSKYVDAIENFQKATEIQPENASFHANLGTALAMAGRISEASKNLKKSIKIEPNNSEAHNALGNLLWESGRVRDAQDSYIVSLSINNSQDVTKANLVKTLGSYTPREKIQIAEIRADKEIRQLNKKQTYQSVMPKDHIINIIEDAVAITSNYEIDMGYSETQIYRRNNSRLNCERHKDIFERHDIIPHFCFGCFKVQVEPNSLLELIRLFFLFDSVNLKRNNTRKCMIELRDQIPGFYKGLIYCSSIAEAEQICGQIEKLVEQSVGPNVSCKVKRGCSEFGLTFQEYNNVDPFAGNALMNYVDDWKKIEQKYDIDYPSERSKTGAPTLSGFCLSDFLIIKNWIGYAKGIGDLTALDNPTLFNSGATNFENLASRRIAFYPFSAD